MSTEVVNLMCPSCGAPTDTSQKVCEFCQRPIVVTTFNSVSDMPMAELNKYANAYKKALAENPENADINASIGMCYLKLKLHEKALEAFEKAIESNFDNSELFFYSAICLLKKASLLDRATIDKTMKYLDSAIMIEPRGIYYFAKAYVKLDYFERKFLKISPKWNEELAKAKEAGVSETDIKNFYSVLGVNPLSRLDISSLPQEDNIRLSIADEGPKQTFTAFKKKKSMFEALLLAFIFPGAGLIYVGKILYGVIWLLISIILFIIVGNTENEGSEVMSVAIIIWTIIQVITIIATGIKTWQINKDDFEE
jgi:tetratricopeptide (TPR) repeat protein